MSGYTPISKSEFEKIPQRTATSKYKEALQKFLDSKDEAWRWKGLTASQVTGLQTQRKKHFKGQLVIRTQQEGTTPSEGPYKGTYTVSIAREK